MAKLELTHPKPEAGNFKFTSQKGVRFWHFFQGFTLRDKLQRQRKLFGENLNFSPFFLQCFDVLTEPHFPGKHFSQKFETFSLGWFCVGGFWVLWVWEGKQFEVEDEEEYIGNGVLSKRGKKTDPTMRKFVIMGSNLSRIKIWNKLWRERRRRKLERESDWTVQMNRGEHRGRAVAYKNEYLMRFIIFLHIPLSCVPFFFLLLCFTLSLVLSFVYFLYWYIWKKLNNNALNYRKKLYLV